MSTLPVRRWLDRRSYIVRAARRRWHSDYLSRTVPQCAGTALHGDMGKIRRQDVVSMTALLRKTDEEERRPTPSPDGGEDALRRSPR